MSRLFTDHSRHDRRVGQRSPADAEIGWSDRAPRVLARIAKSWETLQIQEFAMDRDGNAWTPRNRVTFQHARSRDRRGWVNSHAPALRSYPSHPPCRRLPESAAICPGPRV